MANILGLGDYQVYLDAGFQTNAFRLDSSQLDGTDVLDGTTQFFEVTDYVLSVEMSRGRQKYRQPIDAGRCTIVIDDRDGNFSVVNPNSIYWDTDDNRLGFQPTRRVKIERDSEELYSGQIITYDQELTLEDRSYITIVCTDDLKQLGNLQVQAHTPTAQRSDQRLAAILARPEVSLFQLPGQQNLQQGLGNLGAQKIESDVTVQDYFGRVNQAEQGRIFIARDGTFTFQTRIGRTDGTVIAAEFSDQQDGDIPFRGFKVVFE
jgi:hypothetical protein